MSGEPVGPTYRVRHHYRYVYSGPVCDVRQRLIMVPPDQHADQTLLSWSLDVRGTSGQMTRTCATDEFGNRECRVAADVVEHALDFEANFSVRRGGHPQRPSAVDQERHLYTSFTGLTAPDERIQAAAQLIVAQADEPRHQAELALDWTAGSIAYQVGVTSHQTPAAMALHFGRGVCQDYAHIMLSLLRSIGLSARYVSGHLLGEGAPHAWVEVLFADNVIAFDPTHRRVGNMNYITVAVGRDFADVTSTSGVFSGTATGQLHWSKQAERIDPASLAGVADAAA